jgi:hypothetical protein
MCKSLDPLLFQQSAPFNPMWMWRYGEPWHRPRLVRLRVLQGQGQHQVRQVQVMPRQQQSRKENRRKWQDAIAAVVEEVVDIDDDEDDDIIVIDDPNKNDNGSKDNNIKTTTRLIRSLHSTTSPPSKKTKRSSDSDLNDGTIPTATPTPPLFVIDRVGNNDNNDNGGIVGTTATVTAAVQEKQELQDAKAGNDSNKGGSGSTSIAWQPPVAGSTTESAISVEDNQGGYDNDQDDDVNGDTDDDDDDDDDSASGSSSTTADDSADKLECLDDSQQHAPKLSTTPPVISLSSSASSASSSEYDSDNSNSNNNNEVTGESSELEVHAFAARQRHSTGAMPRRTRHQVVDALVSLARKLRRSDWTRSVQVIKNARVPIIKMETGLGFEADVAIGGHNGSDTSHYAAAQVEKYQRYVL